MDLLNKITSAFNAEEDAQKNPQPILAAHETEATTVSSKNNTTQDMLLASDTAPSDDALALKTLLSKQPAPLKTGDMANGTIIGRGVATIFVDLGAQGTGIIFGREFYKAQDALRNINKGDAISAKVIEAENENGYVELSIKDAGREMMWQRLEEYKNSGATLPVKITAANRGGLVAQVEGMQAFLPVSQLSASHYPRVEGGDKDKIYTELQKFIGQEFTVQILDFAPQEQKLIISEKAVERDELSALLNNYKVGDVVEGTVSGVVDFGVFVRFGSDKRLEGLVHISELDWQMVQNPSSLFAVGDEIQAKIIDMGNGRVSLSVKALKPDPWQDIAEQFAKGATVQGKVVKFSPYGAFIEIAPNVQALIHISEFGNETTMKERLTLDHTYAFRVASVEPKEHRMSLKLADEKTPEAEEEHAPQETIVSETRQEPPEETPQESKPDTNNTETPPAEN